MASVERTVFISYRHRDQYAAKLVFDALRVRDYDVFIDYDGIAGKFASAIVENIRARAHFVLLLTPTALNGCDDPRDWLRKEIKEAIATKRNIVPVLLSGFAQDAARKKMVEKLPATLHGLIGYQVLTVPNDLQFLCAAMDLLHSKLAAEVDVDVHPASPKARQVALAQHVAATTAQPVIPEPVNRRRPCMRILAAAPWLLGLALVPPLLGVGDLPATPAAQNERGDSYYFGLGGLKKSDTVAVYWYRQAARRGFAPAQANLGFMYEKGRGSLDKSDTFAVEWYRKAAEQGHATAQSNLGVMYEHGRGVDKSDTEAAKWYGKSADQGNSDGQASLGSMYERGVGVKEDRNEAVRLYRLSAKQNNPIATHALRRLGEP